MRHHSYRSLGQPKIQAQSRPNPKGLLELPRFRGELRAWDQTSCWGVILSSSCVTFFGSPLAEPFFRPDPHDGAAVARSGGQGRPHLGRPKGVSLTVRPKRSGMRQHRCADNMQSGMTLVKPLRPPVCSALCFRWHGWLIDLTLNYVPSRETFMLKQYISSQPAKAGGTSPGLLNFP